MVFGSKNVLSGAVGWVEEREVIHGRIGYGAEDANPAWVACETRLFAGFRKLYPAYGPKCNTRE
jgi:hypothetical protein